VGPLAHELGVQDGRGIGPEHPEGLVTDLPAVAVRAVEEIATPSFPYPGDVRKLVADPGRDEDAARPHRLASGPDDGEAGVDACDGVADDLDAVAGDLGPPGCEQLRRRHAIAGEVTLHVSGRGGGGGTR